MKTHFLYFSMFWIKLFCFLKILIAQHVTPSNWRFRERTTLNISYFITAMKLLFEVVLEYSSIWSHQMTDVNQNFPFARWQHNLILARNLESTQGKSLSPICCADHYNIPLQFSCFSRVTCPKTS